jgi:hypothetical protein
VGFREGSGRIQSACCTPTALDATGVGTEERSEPNRSITAGTTNMLSTVADTNPKRITVAIGA